MTEQNGPVVKQNLTDAIRQDDVKQNLLPHVSCGFYFIVTFNGMSICVSVTDGCIRGRENEVISAVLKGRKIYYKVEKPRILSFLPSLKECYDAPYVL